MIRHASCLIILAAIMAAGCDSSDKGTASAPPKPPTEEALKTMPPQAAAHASQMNAYAEAQKKAMEGQNAGRGNSAPR